MKKGTRPGPPVACSRALPGAMRATCLHDATSKAWKSGPGFARDMLHHVPNTVTASGSAWRVMRLTWASSTGSLGFQLGVAANQHSWWTSHVLQMKRPFKFVLGTPSFTFLDLGCTLVAWYPGLKCQLRDKLGATKIGSTVILEEPKSRSQFCWSVNTGAQIPSNMRTTRPWDQMPGCFEHCLQIQRHDPARPEPCNRPLTCSCGALRARAGPRNLKQEVKTLAFHGKRTGS